MNIEQRFNRIEVELAIIKKMLTELLSIKAQNSKVDDGKEIMTVNQVAEYFDLDSNFIYASCRKGELPHFKIGKQYRFKRKEITDHIL